MKKYDILLCDTRWIETARFSGGSALSIWALELNQEIWNQILTKEVMARDRAVIMVSITSDNLLDGRWKERLGVGVGGGGGV